MIIMQQKRIYAAEKVVLRWGSMVDGWSSYSELVKKSHHILPYIGSTDNDVQFLSVTLFPLHHLCFDVRCKEICTKFKLDLY